MEKPNRNNDNINKKCGADVVRSRKNKGKENIPPAGMQPVAPEHDWLAWGVSGEPTLRGQMEVEERQTLSELLAADDVDVDMIINSGYDVDGTSNLIAQEEVREHFHTLREESAGERHMPRQETEQTNQIPATAQPCAVAQNQDFAWEFPDVAPTTSQWTWGSLRASHVFAVPTIAATLRPVSWGEEQLIEDKDDEEDEDEDEDYLL